MWKKPGKEEEKARNSEKARNRCGEGQEQMWRRPGKVRRRQGMGRRPGIDVETASNRLRKDPQ
jgi:hypothetical protein